MNKITITLTDVITRTNRYIYTISRQTACYLLRWSGEKRMRKPSVSFPATLYLPFLNENQTPNLPKITTHAISFWFDPLKELYQIEMVWGGPIYKGNVAYRDINHPVDIMRLPMPLIRI
jgi:hypothetical protein